MNLSEFLDLVSTAAVVAGLVFAGLEIRSAGRQRSHESQLLLVRSFEVPEFTRSMRAIMALPDGLSKEEVEERFADEPHLIWFWLGSMESLGILVHHREVPLELVDDFFSGPVVVSWRKLQGYVAGTRREMQRDTMHEWFQWLVERMEAREGRTPPVPANLGERDWHL